MMSFGVGFSSVFWTYIPGFGPTKETAKIEKAEEIPLNRILTPEEQLRLHSYSTFDSFYKVWEFDNFWKRATTGHSLIRWFKALRDWPSNQKSDQEKMEDIKTKVLEILQKNFTYFTTIDQKDMWLDDSGWLGLMGLDTYKLLETMKEETMAQQYLNLSISSWEKMEQYGYDKTLDSKPVPNGCRNNSKSDLTVGVKNTVVNSLFLLLSTSLYQEKKEDRYLEMAITLWRWFETWFDLKEWEYLKPLKTGDAALVQERPTAMINGSSYQDLTHPDWPQGGFWAWSGDQGSLVGALGGLLDIKDSLGTYLNRLHPDKPFDVNAFEKKVKEISKKLVNGIESALIGPDKIFREVPCQANFTTYPDDYFIGRGACIRFLNVLKVKEVHGVDFSENVKATANAMWDKDNQFKPVFTDPIVDNAYIEQFRLQYGRADDLKDWELSYAALPMALAMDFLAVGLTLSKPILHPGPKSIDMYV